MPVTFNYNFITPTVGGNEGAWGDILNTCISNIDTQLYNIDSNSLKLTGGTLSGPLVIPETPTLNGHATSKLYVDNIYTTIVSSGVSSSVPNSLVRRDSNGDFTCRRMTGEATTSQKLTTARTINGVSFDGTTNITIKNFSSATTMEAITIGNTNSNTGVTNTGALITNHNGQAIYAISMFGTFCIGVRGEAWADIPEAKGVYGRVISSQGVGVYGTGGAASVRGQNNNSSGIGVLGVGAGGLAIGVQGDGTSFDFYANGTGANYGPFTGSHEGLILKNIMIQPGDILTDKQIIYKSNLSNCIAEVEVSKRSKQKSVVGVAVNISPFRDKYVPSGLKVRDQNLDIPDYSTYEAIYDVITFNAVGEGQINVCKEGGDIEIGDYICSSSTLGKGKKQDDSILHNYTVAKSREAVAWASDDNTYKTIACTYHCA